MSFTGHDVMFEELESLALISDAVGVSGWGRSTLVPNEQPTERCFLPSVQSK